MTAPETDVAEPVEETGEPEVLPPPVQEGSGVIVTTPTQVPSNEPLMPLDTAKVVEGMKQYQALLHDLLDDSDWQGTGTDRFPKKSAWRKIGRAFNLSVTVVNISVLRDEEGKPTRAECIARATAPNGQVHDGDGYCTIDEFTGKRADDVKLENTLRATATTRAKNRAISDLVGMGEVSSEEVVAGGAPVIDEATRRKLHGALMWLLPEDQAKAAWGVLKSAGGGELTDPIATAVIDVIARRKQLDETDVPADESGLPDPATDSGDRLTPEDLAQGPQ